MAPSAMEQLTLPAKTNDIEAPITNGAKSFTPKSPIEDHMHLSTHQHVTVLEEVVEMTTSRFVADFDHVHEHTIESCTIEDFLDYIEQERLNHMPHRGSRWDRVLKWAEFFALQVSAYQKAVESSVSYSKSAAKLIWTASRVLLELGPDNAQALEITFGAFYKLGLSLSFFLQHNRLLSATSHLRRETGETFKDILTLVRDVSIHYHSKIHGISRGAVTLDFNRVFGRQIRMFIERKRHMVDLMWKYQLGDDVSMEIATLRKWLMPQDETLRTILSDRQVAVERREEYTCEWFQKYLLDFSRGKADVLAVKGPAGCGKSVLYGWILERLQRPLGKKAHKTLSISIQSDIPSKATTLAIAQNLSSQLLEANIGDAVLFSKFVDIYNSAQKSASSYKLEAALWDAIDTGLKAYSSATQNLMIVLDGLDEVIGGQASFDAITKRLETLSAGHKGVQSIVLSRHYSTKNTEVQSFEITADRTHDDMEHVLEHALRSHIHFQDQSEFDRDAVVEQLVHEAKGSFLWALLTVESLSKEKTHSGFLKCLKESPKALDETLGKAVKALDLSKSDTKLLIAWLLVAERPLTIAEVKYLLQVNLEQKSLVERKSEIVDDIKRACGFLVIVQDGFVSFRHPAIRGYFLSLQSEKRIMPWKDAQTDFTQRLLAYCKLSLHNSYEPTFELLNLLHAKEIFSSYGLLEYAVRYWATHFTDSTLHKSVGAFDLPPGFKAMFPGSAQLAMLEWICWESQMSGSRAMSMHDLALRVRQDVFTEKHESVLQTLIICGSFHKRMSHITEASSCFYRASKIGQAIMREHSTVTVMCTTTFLTLTESATSTKRTEVITHREEMLKYVIVAYKHQHGKTSDIVISFLKVLAQLYVNIHEEHNAEVVWREVHEIIIIRHGKGSVEEESISKELMIVLNKEKIEQNIEEYAMSIFDTCSTLELWDIRSIKKKFELALYYEARGEFFLAEELYITLWRRLTGVCHEHNHYGVEIHISTIDVVLEYVRFLRRCHRHEEACSVLICIWTEYAEYEFESETIFLRLMIVGELMKAVCLFSVAVSLFRKCWSWFKSHAKHDHTASCEILISETIEEITTTITKTITSTTTTTSTTTETVIKEVFETAISRTEVTSETISISKTLAAFYIKLERWSEAIEITKKSLNLIWKMVISGHGTIALPRNFDGGAIDIAIQLAICHLRSGHIYEAEEIYVRIYRACRVSCHIDDERLTKAYVLLINFHEEHRHWHKMIEIYKELLVEYRKHLGASHTLTITILYALGTLCSEHGHGHAHEYYEEVVTVLNGTTGVCHHDASKAMIILCQIYYESGQWRQLHDVFKVLWHTWTHHHHEHKFEAAFIELLYKRYIYVLEHHCQYDYEMIRKISVEFRETCLKAFGVFSVVTIRAMIELAQICLRSEKYVNEAVSIFEEVITKTTTTTTTTTTTETVVISTKTITAIKERLAKAYITICSHDTVSTTTIERAINVLIERFELLKASIGCAHTETLIVLREIVLLHIKIKTKEAHAKAVGILQDIIIEILTKEMRSETLHQAAIFIGEIYSTCDFHNHGLEILREVRMQIITGLVSPGSKLGFKLDKSVGKASFVFIATLEKILQGSMAISYSEIMTDLLTEITLYEHYHHCLKSEKDVADILIHAARLRAFLITHHRHDQVKVLCKHTYQLFIKKWGTSIKVHNDRTFVFFVGLLEEFGTTDVVHINIGTAACIASNKVVLAFLTQNKQQEAYEVAMSAFDFIEHQKAYHHLHNVGFGFKLSAYLVNRKLGVMPTKSAGPELKARMLDLSRQIIRSVFKACKDSNINFARLQLSELNDLVGLLGAQQNYTDLEWLLNILWTSRDIQKSWSITSGSTSSFTISLGLRLVQARFLASKTSKAIQLAEDIAYNLRRIWGGLSPKTLQVSEVLAQLYIEAGHFREAMGTHEDILRLIVEGDDGDDRTCDITNAAKAKLHIDLLKRSFQRLGGWDKDGSTYIELVDGVMNMPEYKGKPEFKGLVASKTWKADEKSENIDDKFVVPAEWEFLRSHDESEKVNGGAAVRPKMGVKRASSNWGLDFVHQFFHGDHDAGKAHGNGNGNGIYANGNRGGELAVKKNSMREVSA